MLIKKKTDWTLQTWSFKNIPISFSACRYRGTCPLIYRDWELKGSNFKNPPAHRLIEEYVWYKPYGKHLYKYGLCLLVVQRAASRERSRSCHNQNSLTWQWRLWPNLQVSSWNTQRAVVAITLAWLLGT